MNEDQVKARFLALQLIRLAGVGLTLFSLLIIARRIALPIEAGYVLFVIGLFAAMLAPILLAKRWKSGGQ